MLAKDTSFVERLPGDKASTRSVGCELSACIAPTVETDVLPENSKHVYDSSASHLSLETLVGCLDRAHQDVRNCGAQVSPDQPQIQSFRTILLEVDVLSCLLLDAFLSSTTNAKLSGRLRHAKTALRPPNRPARCCRRFPRHLPRSQWTRPCLGPRLMTLFLLLLP